MNRATRVSIVTVVFLFNILVAFFYLRGVFDLWDIFQNVGYWEYPTNPVVHDKALVFGKLEEEDTEWVRTYFPEYEFTLLLLRLVSIN